MSRVYLAGPISGLTYDQGQDWRGEVARLLAPAGIEVFSPLRGKQHLRGLGSLDNSSHQYWLTYGEILSTPSAIVARDRNDCQRADLVLVNLLGAERVSIGSVMEVAWADAARIPIVLILEEGNVHDHAMLREVAGWAVSTLDQALLVVRSVLLP